MKNRCWEIVIVGAVLFVFAGVASAQPLWEPLNGPEGGWVHAFYEHPLTHDIYAGLRFGGLWKSTDSGTSWEYVALASGGQEFVVTGNERGDIFAGGGGYGGAFVRSTDLGVTWTEVSRVGGDYAVAWDSLLLFGTIQGIYRSTHYGDTAIRVPGTETLDIRGLVRLSDGSCLCGTWEGPIYRSTNAGATWTAVADSVPNIHAFAQYANVVYAVTNRDGVFRSMDSGFHWTNLGLSNIQFWGVQVDTGGTVYVAGFGQGVYRSTNGGATWEQMNSGLTGWASTALLLTSNHRLLLGTEGDQSIYRADLPFVGWEVSSHGLLAADVPAIAIVANSAVYAAKFFEGIVKTTELGQTWQNTGLTNADIRVIAANETTGTILAGSYFGSVYRSTDEGDSWTSVYVGTGANNDVYKIMPAFGAWWAVTFNGLYRSEDDGLSWQEVFYCHYGAGLEDMAVVPTTQTMILVRERSLFDTSASAIFRSTDQGWTWTRLDRTVLLSPAVRTLPDGSIYVINADATMTTDPGFWISTDDGVTWTYRPVFCNIGECVLNSQDDFFIENRAQSGVYRSRDRGVTWELFSSGIPFETWHSIDRYPPITALAIDDEDYLYAGFAGMPIYRTVEPTVGTGIEPFQPLPVQVSLSQNYPNPFNGATSIRYSLPRPGPITLTIYSIDGRTVSVVHRDAVAGDNAIPVDAERLSSGMYFYRLDVLGASRTRKMCVVR